MAAVAVAVPSPLGGNLPSPLGDVVVVVVSPFGRPP